MGAGHLLQTSNWPDVSEGEQIWNGTWATAQRYWQQGLTGVGQALALLREQVEVTNEKVELFVVVAAVVVGGGGGGVWVSRHLQALLIRCSDGVC